MTNRIGMLIRVSSTVALGLILMATLPACPHRESTVSGDRPGFLAFVGVGQDDPLWPVLSGSADRARSLMGMSSLPLRTVAPPISSVSAQRELILRLSREGMVGLCVQVTDPTALRITLDQLERRGVTVVTMMNRVATDEPVIHVEPDDEAIGAALADVVADVLGEEGTLAVLHADSTSGHSVIRRAAFARRLAVYPHVRVLLEMDGGGDVQESRRIVRETTRRFPRLSGWVAVDNWPLRPPLDGEPVLPEGCVLVSVDPMPFAWPLIADGTVPAMVASEYDEIAGGAVRACASAVLGARRYTAPQRVPIRIVRTGNLGEFRGDWQRWSSSKTEPVG